MPIVLLAGGIGITPLLSMARHAVTAEPSRPVSLLLSARTAEQVPFADELRVLARRHPQFGLAIALSGGTADPAFHSGRIDRALIERMVPSPREAVYMLCGPHAMIEEMRRLLEEIGVPAHQVHFEKFETAATLAAAAAGPVTVTLRKRSKSVKVREGETILEAVEGAGETLPSLCRVGVCGTCRLRLLEGKVEGDFEALDLSDREDGFILACVGRPLSDCVVEA
jgi:NADH oxidoreductase Hcr